MIHCLTFKVYKEALPTLNYSTFQSFLYLQGDTSNYWSFLSYEKLTCEKCVTRLEMKLRKVR